MVKRDPDDIISALSRNLKKVDSPTLRITLKRGGLWKKEYAKAHSRIAKRNIKQIIKKQVCQGEREWPLIVRYKENQKENPVKLNCQLKEKSLKFIQSMLSVFRVNFYKRKNQNLQQKIVKKATKANPISKTSLKKKKKTLKNKERRLKRKMLQKQKKKQSQKKKQ